MSCAECQRRARYMGADPEMYRGEDTRCDLHRPRGLDYAVADLRGGPDRPRTREALSNLAGALHLMVEAHEMELQLELPELPKETTARHLLWMLARVDEHVQEWPLDKLGRWLGFVQGVLAAYRVLDVSKERGRVRESFQRAYREDGVAVPQTLEDPG